jgi:hypothetical protein
MSTIKARSSRAAEPGRQRWKRPRPTRQCQQQAPGPSPARPIAEMQVDECRVCAARADRKNSADGKGRSKGDPLPRPQYVGPKSGAALAANLGGV